MGLVRGPLSDRRLLLLLLRQCGRDPSAEEGKRKGEVDIWRRLRWRRLVFPVLAVGRSVGRLASWQSSSVTAPLTAPGRPALLTPPSPAATRFASSGYTPAVCSVPAAVVHAELIYSG